ncbi:hypothetical protein BCR36DRAFT_356915 [Piromyces finnis]|uniref:Shieldin complex subunit 2 first OB fold domain-containing protein n=1 Tax=Piromyces finnis TaxID=1754191 RepID=A0A1Y1V4I9_9FUNG|nr:hypothetical protein BCR36DRAFT_356915 [Piromyces finnis]|eukprot:ORX46374.1 hypothetical protein BCR36DRAFT_356915 [Piromyces finnis]
MPMQRKRIQKDVYLKFNFPKNLKYKNLINDKYNISNENFSFEKKKGDVPMEHKYKVNSSLYFFYQIPEMFTNKDKMKQQLSKSELVNFKFNDLLNIVSINAKIANKNEITDTELLNTIPINGNKFTNVIQTNKNMFPNNVLINENELPNTIPINENELLNAVIINENKIPNTIPVNGNEFPNTIPINNENEFPNTIPINNENEFPNTIPINNGNEFPNTIPINNENEFPNTIPINNENEFPNTIPINENELPNTIPINENEFPNTIPINENELPNTIPINEAELRNIIPIEKSNLIMKKENEFTNTILMSNIPNKDENSDNRQLSNDSTSSSKIKNPTFIKPNDLLLPNNNNNSTQPYELTNDFSQVTQTQNYEASYVATQEYIETDTQDCIQDLNDISIDDNRNKYNEFDENIIPETESEFENSLGYTLSNFNGSYSDIGNDDDISNKRSFLQLDDYDSVIINSNVFSSPKRKKINNSESDSDEVLASESDEETPNINNKSRRTVSDLTSNTKTKNKYNEIKNSLSQEYNPIFLESPSIGSPEFNNFISPHNKEKSKDKSYIDTQISTQMIDAKDNKYMDTQKIPSQSQESIIFSPIHLNKLENQKQQQSQESITFSPIPINKLENKKQQQSQDFIFISPSDIHRYMDTQKIASQEEELISPRSNQYNVSPKILSQDEILSPRMQQLIETQKELLENADEVMIEEHEGMSSQGKELLSPENNFGQELNTETQKMEINIESPLSNRNNISLNQIISNSQELDLLSPDNDMLLSPELKKAKSNASGNLKISSNKDLDSHFHSNQIKNSIKTPDLLLPKTNLYSQTKLNAPENKDKTPIYTPNKKENNLMDQNKNIMSYFNISSNLNKDQEQIIDDKSMNQDIEEIKISQNQNDEIIQEDQDQSINNSQCSSTNPLFSPRLYQDDLLSPEIIIKVNDNSITVNKEKIDENEKVNTKIYENDIEKKNNEIKDNPLNNVSKNKMIEKKLLTKALDIEYNKNNSEYELHSPVISHFISKNENYPELVKTDSNIFIDNPSKSFIENETYEENIINNFIEEYLDKTNIFDNLNENIITENILDDLKVNSSREILNKKKGLNNKEIVSIPSQKSSDSNYIFYSSPIPVLKPRDSDDLSLLSEKEIKEDLGPAFGDLSLDNKLNNENESNRKFSNLSDTNKLNDISGLIVSPSHAKTPINKFSNTSFNKEIHDKTKHPSDSNNYKDNSFINIGINPEFIISPEHSFVMSTPTPFVQNYIFNSKDQSIQINKSKINENSIIVNKNLNESSNKIIPSNSSTSPSTQKEINGHSLNSMTFINAPNHSPSKLQNMISSQSSNPRDFGLPSSIPKTISSISSFEDNPLEEDKYYPMILPPDIEIVDSLDFLVKQYEVELQTNQTFKNEQPFNNFKNYKPKKKYNFIGVVVHKNNTDTIQPKDKSKAINIFDSTDTSIRISSVLISDQSHSFFPIIFWRNNSSWVEKITVGDIILFVNLTLSKYKNKVMANTVGWGNNNYSSRFFIIKNINGKSTINLNNINSEITNRVLEIQNWTKNDLFTKFLFKDSDQFNTETPPTFSTFVTVKQLVNYKNKCINIQGIPISSMKDIKISDDNETYELWKVEIIDVDNNKATIQILMILSDLLQYIHINEQQMYDFFDLIIHEESNNELVLYATKYTRIKASSNIPINIQEKLIEYSKAIKPKDFDTIESLIKSRYNGLASVDAFISKIIFNRTNNSIPLEYPIESTNSYRSTKKRDSVDDILDTIQIYCNKCNEFLFQQEATNITSFINGIKFKNTIDQKINYFIGFIIQKAFWKHCHHMKELTFVYSPIQLILQDTTNDTYRDSQEMSSSPAYSPSSSFSTNSKFNSIYVFLDIHSTKQFYGQYKPEDFIKIRGGLKRKRGRKPITRQITLSMVQNHLRKTDPFKLALSTANESNGDSLQEDSYISSTPDYTSKSVDITQATIFEDFLTILSFENDPTEKIDFDTDRLVSLWNQNLNKYLRPLKKKKNAFVLSCNIQENELKTNLYNIGPIYCKDFRKH